LSSTTIRQLVKDLKIERILKQSENPEESHYSGVRQTANNVRKKITEGLTWLENPTSNDWGEERQMQQAIRAFRSRSRIDVDGRDNTIRLYIYGVDRDILRRELDTWISSYKNRVRQMHQEGIEAYLKNRILHYQKLVGTARFDLNEYRKDNPGVSETELEHLHEQVVEWRLLRSDLERRLDFFDGDLGFANATSDAAPRPSANPEVAYLRSRVSALRLEIDEKIASKGLKSRAVQNLRDRKEVLEARLDGLGLGETSGLSAQGRRQRLQEQKDKATERLAGLMVRERKLREKIEELRELGSMHARAKERVLFYETTSLEDQDRGKLVDELSVRISDRPEVSTSPANRYPHKQVLFGSLGGLFIGLAAAILLEVFSGKVRFRNDITSEFGLPVVGVIPKR
jgi:hypothetical protein